MLILTLIEKIKSKAIKKITTTTTKITTINCQKPLQA